MYVLYIYNELKFRSQDIFNFFVKPKLRVDLSYILQPVPNPSRCNVKNIFPHAIYRKGYVTIQREKSEKSPAIG